MTSVDAESLELFDLVAEADAEVEAAVGKDVDGRGVFGDADRVVQREEEDPGADPDSRLVRRAMAAAMGRTEGV